MQNLYNKNVYRRVFKGDSTVEAYAKTANGVQTLIDSSAVGYSADKLVMIVVEVIEAFANGNGAQTTFKIGQTATDDKFSATSLLTGAALGAKKILVGTLSADADLIVTANDASGTGTGAIKVSVAAFDPTA
jgi:hypothetical protein